MTEFADTKPARSQVNVIHSECRAALAAMPENTFHSCVTDPPYGLSEAPDVTEVLRAWLGDGDYTHSTPGFMGAEWDSFVPGPSIWREVIRVMKPGAHLLCFAGTRTQDLMGVALRLAGFEIRDCIRYEQGVEAWPAWLFAYRKPATRNHLKPGYEPIIVARKPLDGGLAESVTKHGCGALNIEACRVPAPAGDRDDYGLPEGCAHPRRKTAYSPWGDETPSSYNRPEGGRWPSNLVHDGSGQIMDRFASFGESRSKAGKPRKSAEPGKGWGMTHTGTEYNDSGTPARFFFCARASAKERAGFDHPTMKPIALIEYLTKLVTPEGGHVLDPFAGTGTLAAATHKLGMEATLVEREEEYVEMVRKRVSALAPSPNSPPGTLV